MQSSRTAVGRGVPVPPGDQQLGVTCSAPALFVGWPALFALPVVLELPARVALLTVGAVAALYTRWLLFPREPGRRAAQRARLRVRPLGPLVPWVLLASVLVVAVVGAFHIVYSRWAARPATEVVDWPVAYARRGVLSAAVSTLVMAGAAPLTEELAVRGFLMTAIERRHGSAAAVVGSATVFAAIHLVPWAFPEYLVAGVALGALAWAAGSVWASVIAHALWNLHVAALRLAGRAEPWRADAVPAPWLLVALLAVAVAFACVVRALRRRSASGGAGSAACRREAVAASGLGFRA